MTDPIPPRTGGEAMTKPLPEYFVKSATTPDLPLWPYTVSKQRTIITTYRLAKGQKL